MFEARLVQAGVFKMVVDSMKDLIQQANFDVSDAGIALQAMDSSHVCLVSMLMRADGFDHYRCDRSLSMGVHLGNLSKILKCAGNDDILTLKAEDTGDILTLMFESANQERISDFDLKLMSIESEHLGIPDQEYAATVKMPSKEFQRICRDLATIGDSVLISVTKGGIKFSTNGDIGTANVTCRHNSTAEKPEEQTLIVLNEPVVLTFALRYMNNFCKATAMCPVTSLSLGKDLPASVEYAVGELGYVKFYLAPKIEEEEMAGDDPNEAQS